MFISKINIDIIIKFLLQKSSFTQVQLETLFIESIARYKKIKLIDKIYMRKRKNISKGSFLRTLKQAKENLKKSIYTLILAEYLNLIDEGTNEKLIQIGIFLKKTEKNIIKENSLKIIENIERAIDEII